MTKTALYLMVALALVVHVAPLIVRRWRESAALRFKRYGVSPA